MNELTLENLGSWKERNPHWWVINPLMPEEIDWIEAAGRKRNQFGKSRGWVSRTKDTNDDWNLAGIAGEWAASLVLNIPIIQITGELPELHSGDLGNKIEVKTSSGSKPFQWDLIVHALNLKKKMNRAYVHCIGALYPSSMIVSGWAWGWEIADSKKLKELNHRPNDPVKFLEQKYLRDINSLFDEELWRKATGARLF